MTTTQIKKRVERLEGQAPPDTSLQTIMIVGIEPVKEPTGKYINGVPQYRIRPSNEPPTAFFAYCLRSDCEAQQHTPLEGETLAQFEARLDQEHRGQAA